MTEEEKKIKNALNAKLYRAKLKTEGKKVWRSQESIEKRRSYSREYWDKMPKKEKLERTRLANKKSYDRNWQKEYKHNRRHYITKVQNRKIEKLGNGGEHTVGDIEKLWVLQNGKCTWCLKKLNKKDSQVDHKIPVKLGGRNDKGNLQLLHSYCNKSKAAKHPSEYGLKKAY